MRGNRLLVAAVGLCLGVWPSLAAVHTLSGGGATTDVVSAPAARAPKLDPLGKWVVYFDDSTSDGFEQLWAAPLRGGAPVLLTPGSPGDFVTQFEIAPDGSYVAFIGFFDQADGEELYTVPIGGGGIVRRSHLLDPGGYVAAFAISPDSQTLVYTAQTDPDRFDIFRVGAASGSPQGISFTDGSICTPQVDRFAISPDSAWLAFSTQHNCGGPVGFARGLHRVSLAGSSATAVATTYDVGLIPSFGFTQPASGQTPVLVYIFDIDGTVGYLGSDAPAQLRWSLGGGFGSDNVISGSIVSGGNVVSWRPVPGSQNVVFLADREIDQKFELFLVPAGVGGVVQTPTQLHQELGSRVRDGYAVSADGTRVAFVQEDDVPNGVASEQLRSVLIASPGSSTLLESVVAGKTFFRFALTSDSSRVVFTADRDYGGRPELFSTPIGAGTVVQLSPEVNPDDVYATIPDFALSPDGTRVHFVWNTEPELAFEYWSELYTAPVAGGGPLAIGPLVDRSVASGFTGLLAPLRADWAVSINDSASPSVFRLTLSDSCVFCDGFEGTGNGLSRWN